MLSPAAENSTVTGHEVNVGTVDGGRAAVYSAATGVQFPVATDSFHQTEMDLHRMKKYLASFAVVAGLAAIPAGASAAATCLPGQTPGVAPLYCIPATTETSAEAAQATSGVAAGDLSKITPAALAGKGHLTLPGTAAGPGTVKIVITAKIHGKTVVLGSGETTTDSAGAVTVKLTLTKAGKKALKRHKGKLPVTVTASFAPKGGGKGSSASSKGALK
jgi:hypothetical protein